MLTTEQPLRRQIAAMKTAFELEPVQGSRSEQGSRLKAADRAALIYAIGDVHGRRDLLVQVVTRCLADASRRGCAAQMFVLLGDYVDRGPDSAGVIAFLRKFSGEHHIVALVGNHDAMMVEVILGYDNGQNWAANGMASTAISYGFGALVARSMPGDEKRARIVEALRADGRAVEDALWLASLPLYYEDEYRIFVHAGLRPGVALDEQRVLDLLWIREPFLRSRQSYGKLVVHGHTPVKTDQPEVRSNRVGLDTAAWKTEMLTAAVFEKGRPELVAYVQTTC